jgi:hypothetical protein
MNLIGKWTEMNDKNKLECERSSLIQAAQEEEIDLFKLNSMLNQAFRLKIFSEKTGKISIRFD